MSDAPKEKITLRCSACDTANRFPVERALRDLAAVLCGSCGAKLLRVDGEPLTGLEDRDLTHPFDRNALDALKKIPGADRLISTVLGATFDKLIRFNLLAGAVRVGENQAPRLWELYQGAAERLDVDPPPLFLVQDPRLNAAAMGAADTIVTVNSSLADSLDDEQLLGVLGHELTHVRLNHVLYRTLAIMMALGAEALLSRFLGLASMLVWPLKMALFRWYQMAELSADRGELLTTGSLESFIRTHRVLSGGSTRFDDGTSVGAFIEQAHEAEELRDENLFVYLMEMRVGAWRTHPLPAWRVHHALKWARTDDFFRILAGPPRG